MEDIRQYYFAPVYTDAVRPSEEQLGAIDDLIDSMMLVNDKKCVFRVFLVAD